MVVSFLTFFTCHDDIRIIKKNVCLTSFQCWNILENMNRCSCNYCRLTDKELNNLNRAARVFSSKSKLKILLIFLAREHCVCEIQKCLCKEQSLISHHLSDLVEEGWIKQRRGKDARQVFYSLTKEGERKLEIFIKLGGKK